MSLYEQGVQVFDFLRPDELSQFHAKLIAYSASVPEFVQGEASTGQLALGAFQGLNFASNWHEPTVARPLRLLAHERVRPIITDDAELLHKHNLLNLQQLPDRMLIREPRTSVSKEMWHRDAPAKHDDGDLVLGGWINLDPEGTAPQRFICVPASHYGVPLPPCTGFAPIKDVALTKQYFANERVYNIKPGQAILFYSHIVHRIASSSGVHNKTFRLFMGWRLTDADTVLIDDLDKRLDNQDIIPLPSAQVAPMYPMAYLNYFGVNEKRLVAYASRLVPKMRTTYNHKKTGRSVTIPIRIAPSLVSLGLPYPAYSTQEKRILGL